MPRRPLGCNQPNCKGSLGDSFFNSPNPDFGATFTYYLADGIKSSKDNRREAEKKLEAENKDVMAASWDTVIAESREDAPAIVFTVTAADGSIVRRVEGPTEPGFHRVSWDLRYPSIEPWTPQGEGENYFGSGGVLVVPGRYRVEMQQRVDGVLVDLGQSQSFDVVSIRPDPVLPGSTQEHRVIFESRVDELSRAAQGTGASIDALIDELDAVKQTLVRARTDGALYEMAQSLQRRLKAAKDRLGGNEARALYNDLPEMTVGARLWHARFSPQSGAYGPTAEQQESLQLARAGYDEIIAKLRQLVDEEYAGLKEAMDKARVPWTPGRGIQ